MYKFTNGIVVFDKETRDDYYPIIETNNATIIYRSYIISLLSDLNKLKFLDYIYLDSLYIDNSKFNKVIKIFKAYIDNTKTLEDSIEEINNLEFKIEDGFKYKDSVYQKEELKNA